MLLTYVYQVPEMMCGGCGQTVKNGLDACDALSRLSWAVDAVKKELIVEVDDSVDYRNLRDLINHTLAPIGFSCQSLQSKKPRFSSQTQGLLGLGSGLLCMFLSLFFAPMSWLAMAGMLCVSVPLTLFLGYDSYRIAYKKIRTGTLTMDTLFVMSTTTIMLVSVASLMMPLCPMMIDAALLIFGFRHLGRAIDGALRQVGASRVRFQDLAPKEVTKIVDNQRIRVRLDTIVPGDYLHLTENSILPVDGVVEHGSGFILDRRITGSSKPRRIVCEEQLHAGIRITKVTESLTFRATAAMEKSHLMTLDGKITRAKLARSWAKGPLESETNRILQYFIPIVLTVALGSGLVVGYFFSWALALSCLATVLVSACPCTFGLIIPLCMKIGMQKAAARGVVFQSSAKLEASNDIQCVVFDLNGTLTEGKPGVRRYEALPESGLSDDELLAYAKTLEQKSKHPLADAIRTTARHCAVVFNREVINDLQPHAGVAARWQDSAYSIGGEEMLVAAGVDAALLDRIRMSIAPLEDESVIYLARGPQVLGYFVMHDALRDGAIEVVDRLKSQGIEPYLCTGTDAATALRYANRLGIAPANVRAQCVSHASNDSEFSKRKLIDDLHRRKLRVAAVGDGDNDSEMFAASDMSFVLHSHDEDECIESHAGALIKGTSLLPLLHGFDLAKRTVTHIQQNLGFSLLYNVASMLLPLGLLWAYGVLLNPAVGAALMIAQSSLILWQVSRFADHDGVRVQTQARALPTVHRVYSRAKSSLQPGAMPDYGLLDSPQRESSSCEASDIESTTSAARLC